MEELRPEDFTRNLKRLRIDSGHTQESLAEKLNMAPSTVNRWESGQNSPGYADFYKIMQAFNVSFEELAGAKPINDRSTARPSIEEALKVIADETGISISLPKSIKKNPIPPDVREMALNFPSDHEIWEGVKGLFDVELEEMKSRVSSQRAR